MRLRNITGSREVIAESPYVVPEDTLESCPGTWHDIFGNDHPIHIEIGMGKGRFLMDMATLHPEINYVGIEKYSSVLLRGIQKQEELQLPNVMFIRMEAEYITEVFAKDEVDRIYLNFSTPYPQKGSAGKRLSNPRFIAVYDKLLLPGGEVIMKTDNAPLFEYSIESFSSCGYLIKNVTTNLHDSELSIGNVVTEYEKSFTDKGLPIFSFTAVKRA